MEILDDRHSVPSGWEVLLLNTQADNVQWIINARLSRKKPAQKAPVRGMYTERESLAVCVAVNPAVTEPDPADTDAVRPAGSVFQAYTSRLHHVKGF